MKKIIFLLLIFSSVFVIAQERKCKSFVDNEAIPKLGDYMVVGKTHLLELQTGEEILIFKTVTKNLQYRFVVVADENLPKPQFIIVDWNDNIIYDNSKDNFNSVFDFSFIKTQRIKIWIKVPELADGTKKKGCVSLVVGVKTGT